MDEAGGERLTQPSGERCESIRRLVRKRLEAAKAGDFVEYTGREGLRRLARSEVQGAQETGSGVGAALSVSRQQSRWLSWQVILAARRGSLE